MRFLLLMLLLFQTSIGTSQESKKISCRFLCLDSDKPVPPLLNIGEKGTEIACAIQTDSLSPAIYCTSMENVISFVTAADRKPAATASIPADGSSFILIFIEAAQARDALPWRVFVIENSPKNFPDGGAFIANFHNQDIRFVMGDIKLMLHPGTSHGFAAPKDVDNFNMAPVRFEFLQNDVWRVAKESMLRFLPGMRYLIFAYVDPKSGRPRISTFRDLEPNSKAPEPAKR